MGWLFLMTVLLLPRMGVGLPSPPLGMGREAAGGMAGRASPLSAGGERELGPHTSRFRSELRAGLGANCQ